MDVHFLVPSVSQWVSDTSHWDKSATNLGSSLSLPRGAAGADAKTWLPGSANAVIEVIVENAGREERVSREILDTAKSLEPKRHESESRVDLRPIHSG